MAARTVRVWAPRASRVDLVVENATVPMRREDDDFVASVEAEDGDRYGFSLDGGEVLPDPRGLRMPDGHDRRSAFYDPSTFAWTDGDWAGAPLARNASTRRAALRRVVIAVHCAPAGDPPHGAPRGVRCRLRPPRLSGDPHRPIAPHLLFRSTP